ncbi:NF-kappa-B essential modulator kenny [Arctopsyche grandis]|uniref:NF-kappa-B essential modulator kenny n=1 Tax=Arctopsyche grandis TaxID=121162 RepID=UPI00406D961D
MNSLLNGDLDEESIVVLGSSITKSELQSTMSENRVNNCADEINELHEYVKLDYNGDLNNPSQFSLSNMTSNVVKIEDEPSMGSMMIASNIVTNSSISEMQHKIANILDENNILRDALKHNNTSIKEQFKTIVSWRDDVMKTYNLHKTKFAETKELIEKLKTENVQQKKELDSMKTFMLSQYSNENLQKSSVSYEQLVDDSKVDLLTDHLQVLEKEKRKVLHENEELLWQKDSLQNIIDFKSSTIQELQEKLHFAEKNESALKNTIKLLETKVTTFQEELKSAQCKLSESENLKLEHSQYKQNTQNSIRHLKIEVQELKSKLKDAYVLTLQPIRFSLNLEECHDGENYKEFHKNVEIYDKTLKDLSAELNSYSNEFCTLFENFTLLLNALNPKIPEANSDQTKMDINTIQKQIDNHHKSIAQHNQIIKSTLSTFENIFKDFKEVIDTLKSNKIVLNALSAELFSKKEELHMCNDELKNVRKLASTIQKDSDQMDLLKAQIEVYKTDFEAERIARTEIAAEKQSLVEQLRVLHLSKQKLVEDFDGYRLSSGGPSSSADYIRESPTTAFTEVFSCPICQECFESSNTLQHHANSCIDKNG